MMQNVKETIEQFLGRKLHILRPFEGTQVEFCDSLSKALFAQPGIRDYPDLAALAFWLRKGHVEELKERFASMPDRRQILVPRGIAFHIPPRNVETMFVYSWILSLLTGNANIVRLPTKQSPTYDLLFGILQEVMQRVEFHKIQEMTCLISYGHEEEITSFISAHADIRVIWGGDETIKAIRQFPLKVNGKEMVFADRFAYGAIHSFRYLQAESEERQQLARDFYRDVFWYDQGACSSPRMLIWTGPHESTKDASHDFYRRLHKVLEEKSFSFLLGTVLQKQTQVYSNALDIDIDAVQSYGNALTVIKLYHFDPRCREHGGGGLLYHLALEDLKEMVHFVNDKDQTLVYYGYELEDLFRLAEKLNGRGLDRIVPIGRALNFDYIWDGYDMLAEFTRRIQIE